ncbi:hypothetical protein M409DRAFT_71287 [Zasmidium cellare ATCC 36951]|uniref:RRM domain-containing protein n=1 Tax=Zasmidium cellare ATCC 36951 TaxID=1080233 RepID=A0A6A6BZQ1_ZASCE|nr:uncharacterized protein M409DRAFT_71287 [Zasmidium cellare ATCC 36951]KAF2159039.1 hypothetical protein M409DRAFT_71287 [Zasmidium cellare ATCC 36951]
MDQTVRLYVGNLPYAAQREDIETLFAKNNVPLKKMDMSIDPFTGRNPSYCFVELDPADADLAMEALQGQTVRGRPVKVNLNTQKGPRTHRPLTVEYEHSRRTHRFPTTNATNNDFAFDRWSRQDAESHWTAPFEERRRLFVGGLSRIPNQDVVNAEMRGLFDGYDVQAVSKLISPRDNVVPEEGSQYYCFVDVGSAEEAESAVPVLNGKPTPYVQHARQKKPTIVQREQLGVPKNPTPGNRARDLAGSWRRVE